jgi:8-oxo-dGTP pyrophosphatase MutT (NUDIX family)
MVTGVTGRSVLPPDQYAASLARKRMAATAFFRDDQGRVLLVNPVYKETWDLPGGAVEAEESPHAASEIKEIVLADGELAGFAFVARDGVAGLVTPLLTRRVASCLDAVTAGAVAALEDGSPVV